MLRLLSSDVSIDNNATNESDILINGSDVLLLKKIQINKKYYTSLLHWLFWIDLEQWIIKLPEDLLLSVIKYI